MSRNQGSNQGRNQGRGQDSNRGHFNDTRIFCYAASAILLGILGLIIWGVMR